jgi:hypothetical protein
LPDAYLGAEVKKWTIDGAENSSKVRWAMSSNLYVKRAVTEVERKLEEIGERLSKVLFEAMGRRIRARNDKLVNIISRCVIYCDRLIVRMKMM